MRREDPREFIEQLIRRTVRKHISARDKILVETVFSVAPTQAQLDRCLDICDIEVMGGYKSLMLSYLMKERPELAFSDYNRPRLEGLIRYYRFANARVLSHFSKIGKVLNREGIPILLLKGVVLKALRPELARPMGDADFLVPKERLCDAVRVCESLGYHNADTGALLAVDIHTKDGQSAVDIHATIPSCGHVSEIFQKHVIGRARVIQAFGVEALCPAPEDLVFIIFANVIKNMRLATTPSSLYYSLLDCRWLLQTANAFDWDIVRRNAIDTGSEIFISLAVELLNQIAPGVVPASEIPLPSHGYGYCKKILADEDYFHQRAKAQHWARQVRIA